MVERRNLSDRTAKYYAHACSALVAMSFMLTASLAAENHPESASTPKQIAPVTTPFEMPQLKPPSFPHRTVDIRDHGAVGDGTTVNTKAFASAIAACAQAGGGRVLVPEGAWLTGAIHLKSNINLHLQKGAVVCFSTDPKQYLPVVFTRWAGFECYNYSPLIYARDCTNIAVTGLGKLDGQGKAWWSWTRHQNRVARKLYDLVLKDTPVEDRVFGTEKEPLRPQFISPINCKNVLIEGVSLNSGPFWTIQLVYCQNVIVRKVSISNHGPNNDGVNLDSCRNVLIEHCHFDTGDDCIALKSGLNEDGWRVGRPCENIVIRHCRTKRGHGGVVIGSEMSGGVRNVFVHDCHFDGTDRGIRMKSTRGRGGVVENIWIQDITMDRIGAEAIRLNTFYKAWFSSNAGKPPTFRNIHIRNVTCQSAGHAVQITGLPEKPIENITLENISMFAKKGLSCTNAKSIKLTNVKITPKEGSAVDARSTTGLEITAFSTGEAHRNKPIIRLTDTQDVTIQESSCPTGTGVYLKLRGEKTKDIRLINNDLSGAQDEVELGHDVDENILVRD